MLKILSENPSFRRFILGRFCALVSDNILLFVIPLIVYRTTGSVKLSGIAFFIEWVPQVVSLPLAGSLADRFGGKRLFIISDIVRFTTTLLTATVIISSPAYSFPVICVCSFICAFFQSQSLVSVESLVPRLFAENQLVQTQSLLQTIQQMSIILGPMLCGIFVIFITKETILYIAAALYLLSFLNIGTLDLKYRQESSLNSQNQKARFTTQLRQSSTFILTHPKLLILVLYSLAINMVIGLLLAGSPIIAISSFAISDQAYSLLQLSLGFTSIIALTLTSSAFKRFSGEFVFSISTLFIMLGGFVSAMAPHFSVYVLGYSMVMASLSFFNVYMRSERVKLIPPQDRGKVISIMIMFNLLPLPLCGVMISVSAKYLSIQSLLMIVFTITTSVVISLMALRWFSQKKASLAEKPQ